MTDEQAEHDDDVAWSLDGVRNGWTVEHLKASAPWRVWGVRHVRFVWHLWWAERQARMFGSVGIGIGALPAYDRWVLHAILRGWA